MEVHCLSDQVRSVPRAVSGPVHDPRWSRATLREGTKVGKSVAPREKRVRERDEEGLYSEMGDDYLSVVL